ncbi:MAG: hypothetical protein HQL37_01630 [Alphaproteobacteria bacterium]|nr:hypothetical protein [Alphaproteobacteria bacterium]
MFIGLKTPLVVKKATADGEGYWVARPWGVLDRIFADGFGPGSGLDTVRIWKRLEGVAHWLNQESLAGAVVHLTHTRIPAFSSQEVAYKVALNDILRGAGLDPEDPAIQRLVRKYSHDQPRDDHGRWTAEGGGDGGQDLRVAADDGMPGDHDRANKQVRAIARKLGLNKDQREELHHEISGKNMNYKQILDEAKDRFGK